MEMRAVTQTAGSWLRRSTRRRGGVLACALTAVCLTACEPDVPPKKPAPPPAPAEADDAPLPEEAPASLYVYSPVGKRDPFRDPSTNHAAPPAAKAGPLQQYDLDQLKLSFTETATSSPMAFIVDPTGAGHVVQIGDFVGKNWGKVSAIKRDEVTVMEITADPNTGHTFPEYLPLRMPKSEGDKGSSYQVNWSKEAENPL